MLPLENKNILLIISGGIAAYKTLELIRLIRKAGGTVTPVLTKGGRQFVTELSVAALSESQVYSDLWSLKDETEMGHIRLSRESDVIMVAPASANLMARMAHGLANDLASTVLLATDKPVMIAPAMNPMMWANPATQRNVARLKSEGIDIIGPRPGDMACGETGQGRMAEPEDLFGALIGFFKTDKDKDTDKDKQTSALHGKTAVVTSGPTYEPLDPVRFLGNRSSGKQGHAIARALARQGVDVTLISGPVALPDPPGVTTIHVETARDMLAAVKQALPVDIAVCAAAVSDWSAKEIRGNKIKKRPDKSAPALQLKENPDILHMISQDGPARPDLVIGFAAETENILAAARKKKIKKGCDWIVVNDVSPENDIFGSDHTRVTLITDHNEESWQGSKALVADNLCDEIEIFFTKNTKSDQQETKAHG